MNLKKSENIFVFVVCGENKHIDKLQFSLKYLQYYSNNKVLIITDLSRNDLKIEFDNIINIKTPENLNNHQASIWLKTSLHKILPKGNLYCYIDSDVIAVNKNCNNIFNEFVSPITFAKDHSNLQEFSAFALNCSCLDNKQNDLKSFEENVASVIKSKNFPPDYNNVNIIKLFGLFDEIQKHPLKNLLPILRMLLCYIGIKIKIKDQIILNKKEKAFIIGNENYKYPSLYLYKKKIHKETNYKFNIFKWNWVKSDKTEFSLGHCNHLKEAIKTKFKIHITDANWNHWNGGVFLFNDESYSFMEDWHCMTNEIFKDQYWKTRDQGTLIAAVWKNNLNNHKYLPEIYNFLTNYKDPTVSAIIKNNIILAHTKNNKITPNFIHVYNEFYKKGWDIWDCIEKIHPQKFENK